MKLAAIDIGSNAARLIISRVIKRKSGKIRFKKIHYMRYPLQLGKDVFQNGEISKAKRKEIVELMKIFKNLITLYNVKHYMACATSAMRESENGDYVVKKIFEKTSLNISIIDGNREAQLINSVLHNFIDPNSNSIHIDVGGGSTELNVYINGKKEHSQSFKIGTVRNIKNPETISELNKMIQWIESNQDGAQLDYAIGTGGNIRKIHKMSRTQSDFLNINEILKEKHNIEQYSRDERISILLLNPDRADVIIPAANIYLKIMELCKIDKIKVPDIGLKDGIMKELYENTAFLIE